MNTIPQQITIIGVGLIGGSIALGLKLHLTSKITILGLCSDSKRARLAKERGIIDQTIFNVTDIPKTTDLVIIATPVSVILKILPHLAKMVSSKCLIIDVGSTKEMIMNLVESKYPKLSFIGSHPMAGSEMSGFENADPYLFQNKPWIICPAKNIKKDQLQIVEELIKILGGKLVVMSPSQHDQIIAFSSHLYLILGSILISEVSKQPKWNQIAKIASTGFRDTTRLASHNPDLKADIILSNKENIIDALLKTKIEIDNLIKLIQDNDSCRLFAYFQLTKTIRDNWLEKYFS